jgi:menaquinol-cytochrome c reductase iron-sulfur subunit
MTERRVIPLQPVVQSADRRSFLGGLFGVALAGVGALLSVPLVRLGLHPILGVTTGTAWSDAGALAEFASATVPVKVLLTVEQRDGWRKISSTKPVYVVRAADGRVKVLSAVCPHLGCTVSWNEDRAQFVSPCHNGVFGPDGAFVSGPPPRGMDELENTIDGGRLKVRYQYFRQLVPTREVIA